MVALMMTDSYQLNEPASVLELHDLTVTYTTEKGPLDIVRNVSLDIRRGEVYGLVGESGSGKTTLAMAVVRYLARNGGIRGGSIFLNGQNLLELSPNEMRRVWGSKISIVHQDPGAAINPMNLIRRAPHSFRISIVLTAEPPVANIGSRIKQTETVG